MGRTEEALSLLHDMTLPVGGRVTGVYVGALKGNADGVREGVRRLVEEGFRDPEGLFYASRALARVGAGEEALALLEQVAHGYFVADALENDAWYASLRGDPRLVAIIAGARSRRAATRASGVPSDGPCASGATSSSPRPWQEVRTPGDHDQ